MTMNAGIDLDAIYNGDAEATGDAVRLLATALSLRQGVLPVLTDRIIVPTFAGSGLLVETESGTPLWRLGEAYTNSTGTPSGSINNSLVDLLISKRIFGGDVVDVDGNWLSPTLFGIGATGSNSVDGIGRTLFRAIPTADDTIDSIYRSAPNSITGLPDGQIIVIWNDSDYVLTLHDSFGLGGTGGSAHTFIINGPVELGPQGAAVLVYDENYDWPGGSTNGGWRIVATAGEGPWHSYATTWAGSVTNPSIGDGTLLMTYSLRGKELRWKLRLGIGSTTNLGSGLWTFSLPYSISTIMTAAGAGFVFDAGTQILVGTTQITSATTFSLITHADVNILRHNGPIAWVNADYVMLEGTAYLA